MQIAEDIVKILIATQPGDANVYDMLCERGITDADLDVALDYLEDNLMMDEDGTWVRIE